MKQKTGWDKLKVAVRKHRDRRYNYSLNPKQPSDPEHIQQMKNMKPVDDIDLGMPSPVKAREEPLELTVFDIFQREETEEEAIARQEREEEQAKDKKKKKLEKSLKM